MATSTIDRTDIERTSLAQPVKEEREEWRPRWELVECTCPDFCERDHELD